MGRFWPFCFFAIVLGYCFSYAPYGTNETDGGFLTGLAWQVLNGKVLYQDVVYVRPPLPVWLRALELTLLPEHWAILGERWIFYGKVALYSGLGAATLRVGTKMWLLASFAFVVSVHCYPAAAWHTVDGILFGVLSIWCRSRLSVRYGSLLSGMAIVLCLLCKQSFYPMGILWLAWILRLGDRGNILRALAGASAVTAGFCVYLSSAGLWSGFLHMTGGAASGGQAFRHGVLDYFHIQPILAAITLLFLLPFAWRDGWKRHRKSFFVCWAAWLLVLCASYGWTIVQRQEFTAPFAQSRLLFWCALSVSGYRWWLGKWSTARVMLLMMLLGLSWCASISWGYNLPILFALPWVFVAVEVSERLFTRAFPGRSMALWSVSALCVLLVLFRLGYGRVYRDGPRADMNTDLGTVFPQMSGIYSSAETAAQYRELKDLTARYGPNVKTLPAFPQANYLTHTVPPLPLDWVVQREMGDFNGFIDSVLIAHSPVLLIEKAYLSRLDSDPELAFVRAAMARGRVVEDGAYFRVVR